MRTQTLLLAAVTLAAGIFTSQAQPVYSANVVGYINMTIPAGGYQIVGNTLINGSDANKTNNDINASLTTGFVSQPLDPPNLHSNSVFYSWNGSGFAAYYYFNQADATTWEGSASPAGWYRADGVPASINLNQSQAAFIQNNSSGPMTITLTGTVLQGTNNIVINTGYNLISLAEPISTNANVTGYGLPGNLTSSPLDPPNQNRNDTLYSWNGTGFAAYFYFNAADATTWEGSVSPAGFYRADGVPMPASAYPLVNQGFFFYHSGSPVTWTNAFTVQ